MYNDRLRALFAYIFKFFWMKRLRNKGKINLLRNGHDGPRYLDSASITSQIEKCLSVRNIEIKIHALLAVWL